MATMNILIIIETNKISTNRNYLLDAPELESTHFCFFLGVAASSSIGRGVARAVELRHTKGLFGRAPTSKKGVRLWMLRWNGFFYGAEAVLENV
jgi:hypothetical protein